MESIGNYVLHGYIRSEQSTTSTIILSPYLHVQTVHFLTFCHRLSLIVTVTVYTGICTRKVKVETNIWFRTGGSRFAEASDIAIIRARLLRLRTNSRLPVFPVIYHSLKTQRSKQRRDQLDFRS